MCSTVQYSVVFIAYITDMSSLSLPTQTSLSPLEIYKEKGMFWTHPVRSTPQCAPY